MNRKTLFLSLNFWIILFSCNLIVEFRMRSWVQKKVRRGEGKENEAMHETLHQMLCPVPRHHSSCLQELDLCLHGRPNLPMPLSIDNVPVITLKCVGPIYVLLMQRKAILYKFGKWSVIFSILRCILLKSFVLSNKYG